MKAIILALSVLCLGFSQLVVAQDSVRQTIKLGVVAPLSGDFAYQGNYIRQGVQIAVDQLSASGKQIEVYYEDACLPAQALSAAHKLIDQGIQALVGSYCVIGMVPMAPLLERSKVLAFQTSVVPDALLTAGDFVLSTNIAIQDEAFALARLAFRDLNLRRAGVLFFPSDWGSDYSRYFSEEFERLGGKVVANDQTQMSQMDFRGELTRMKARGVDVIFGAHISSALGVMVKQARALGINVQFLSTDEAEDPQFFAAAGDAANDMLILAPEPEEFTPVVTEFRRVYRERHQGSPPVTTSNAYDATKIAVQAIESCDFDPECMKRSVYAISNFDGASGRFSIEADGRTKRGLVRKIARAEGFDRIQ